MVDEIEGSVRGVEAYEHFRLGRQEGRIAGLKEALEIAYGFTGKEAGEFRIVGAGVIWNAINIRISELEKDSNV